MNKFAKCLYAGTLITIAILGILYFFVIPAAKKDKEGTGSTASDSVSVISDDSTDKLTASELFSDLIKNVGGGDDPAVSSAEPDPEPSPDSDTVPSIDIEILKQTDWPVPDNVDRIGHPLLTDYEVIFMGDSLFTTSAENHRSIPDYFGFYTGATIYNVSREAMCASQGTNGWTSLPEAADAFRGGWTFGTWGDELLDNAVVTYHEADHTGKKIIVIIDCCVNDYAFSGPLSGSYDSTENYQGGLRYAVDAITESLPDATIYFMTPYNYTAFDCGTELNAYLKQQNDYINSMLDFCNNNGYQFIDMRGRVPMAETAGLIMDDGIHPTEEGSRRIAEALSLAIGELLKDW